MENDLQDEELHGRYSQLMSGLAEIERIGRKRGKLADWAVFATTLLASTVFPIIEGVVFQNLNSLHPGVFWGIVGAHAVLAFLSIWGSTNMAKLTDAIDNLEAFFDCVSDLKSELGALNKRLDMSVQQVNVLTTSLAVLRGFLETGYMATQVTIGKLLTPMVQDRADVLGYTAGDHFYNIVVYKWDDQEQLLKLKYRECDDRIQRKDRDWQSGSGHVGKCYLEKRPIISSDTDNSREFLSANPEHDLEYYRSIAAFPIPGRSPDGIGPSTQYPIGVLEFTNNFAEHFDNSYITFGTAYANLLSIFLENAQDNDNS